MANIDDIKRRAKKGKVDACLQLLQYFAQGSNGVSKDTFEAKKWGQRAISSWSGKDWQQVDLQDYQYTLKQASNGDPEACLLIASYYGTGTNNVLKNGSKANAWIEKAIGYFANSSFSPSTNDDINTPYSGSAEEEKKYSDEYESDESEDDSDDNEEETDNVLCHFDKTEFLNAWHKNQIRFEP